jgi:tetratricopeptide (TPR) repeat protein
MYKKVHPDRGMTINLDGELWVPVEITLVGRSGFIPAWKRGMEQWQEFDDEDTKRGFYRTRDSQTLYRPVGLKETDLGLQYPDSKKIEQGFRTEMGEIVDLIVADFRDNAMSSGKKEDWNKFGIALAKFRQYGKAEEAFLSALRIDPNVDYLKGNYRDALYRFTRVYENLQREGKDQMPIALKVLLNISKANYELRQFDNSKLYFDMAHSINPVKMEKYSYLGNAVNDELRSAQVIVIERRHDILFAGDDE